ncbi:MAG: MATE family efflux transporter [Roseburia sp.]|nr:MATE family efflux transporter [Roseburia sp.]
MENEKTLDAFNKMSVPQAVIKNTVPAMIAMLMVLIYNLADTFFIGQTHDAYQVAAVSLATPVFLMFMAVGTVFGIGGTSVISRAMGEGKKEYAKKVCSFCMWACVLVGLAMTLLFLLFMDEILLLIGASDDTWEFARSYLTIVSYSGVFVLISNCYSNILRAEGQATRAMTGQIIGNLLNVVLDPLMILGFGWNITGAAIATVIGNVAAASYYIIYFLRGKSSLSISIKDFSVKNKICSGVLAIGIPASLASVLMSISQMVMNGMMAGYGDMAIAGIGVAMKVTMITGMIAMGIGQGIQPLLGYCVGAKTWERYKEIMRFSLWFAFFLGLIMTIFCYLFTNQIVSVFLTDENAFDYAVRFAKILLTTSTLFGVFYVLTNALQAMGAAVSSLIINLSRQGIIYIPALFVLRAALGVTGLVWAQPVADILSIILAVILYQITFRKMRNNMK